MSSPHHAASTPSRVASRSTLLHLWPLALTATLVACGAESGAPRSGVPEPSDVAADAAELEHDDHEHDASPMILLNRAGRDALGVAVAPVERRPRRGAFDLPGSIELVPGARRAAAAPVEGRLGLVVQLLDEVRAGDPLFTLEAPALRELKASIAELDAELLAQESWLHEALELERAHRDHEAALGALVERWQRRLTELSVLRDAAGGQGEALAAAETALVEARARFAEARELGAEHHAEVAERTARRIGLAARRDALLGGLAEVLGVSVASLDTRGEDGSSAWQNVSQIVVRATTDGLVDDVSATDGAWAHAGDLVLSMRRPRELWVRAEALQSDLDSLERAAVATVRPANAVAGDAHASRVTLFPGLAADAERRTAEVLARFEGAPPAWARPGLAVSVGAIVAEADAGFAVPAAAVRRDGLDRGVWVEDPATPARLVFVHVEVLAEERGWVWIDDEVHAEHPEDGEGSESPADHEHGPVDAIRDGARVVVRGAGRLLLATKGSEQQGGHFHADGTFHAEDH
jgi:hypothetical protein